MNDEEQRAADAIHAIRLLRALVDQAMVEGGHEDVAGVTVVPSAAAAEEAGMVLNTPRYNAALEALLGVGRWGATKKPTRCSPTTAESQNKAGRSRSRPRGWICWEEQGPERLGGAR